LKINIIYINKIRAQEEINQVLGAKTYITYEHSTKLKYCSAIFKEALRLYPPGAVLFRSVTDDIEISSYKIPKNTTVLFSSYTNARYEKYFPSPFEFKPERFLNDSVDAIDSS